MQRTDERRGHDRHVIQMPVNVSTDERRDRAGVMRDLSSTGMLFHSRSKFAIGERVTVLFKVAHRKGTSAGQVVRIETDDHPDNIFPFRTAVQFDAPLLDLPL